METFYRFPEIVHPSEKNLGRTPFEQGQKIIEEAIETFEEAKKGNRDKMLVECLDVIHAAETMLRRNYTEGEVMEGWAAVYRKNKMRGFYDA